MTAVKGQCFDCYDNSMFQYIGQTGKFNSKDIQLKYVSGLTKPTTTVDCVTCGRIIEYQEQSGKWTPTIK